MISIKRAIVSVSSKEGLIPLCKVLFEKKVEILCTTNTHHILKENGISSILISEYTGFPELINGRVKTLHPKIFAGILARESHQETKEIQEYQIGKIDLVCVNLYPFDRASENTDNTEIWQDEIDIGGVSLLRASAKNYQECVTLSDPVFYPLFLEEFTKGEGLISIDFSYHMMQQTFLLTGQYDLKIAKKFLEKEKKDINVLIQQKTYPLRYGENPHQSGAYWNSIHDNSGLILGCQQLHGKDLSYNNILDVSMGLDLSDEFEDPASVIVKHNNPCGVSENLNLAQAYQAAYACDPVSAYGGVFLFNREVTKDIAVHVHSIFAEIVCAPSFSEEALSTLRQKKNIRLLQRVKIDQALEEVRSVGNSFLIQEKDRKLIEKIEVKSGKELEDTDLKDIYFGIKVVKHVKSNAIVIVKNKTTIGICGGQPNRINSTLMSLKQAGAKAIGATLVSDAYFPFSDSLLEAKKAEIKIVVEPGGSIRDPEIIDEAKKNDIILVFTGLRHFLH